MEIPQTQNPQRGIHIYFRLGKERRRKLPNGKTVWERPVNKVIRPVGESFDFILQEAEVAPNLAEFRKQYDNPVSGEPGTVDLQEFLATVPDEELKALGYAKQLVTEEDADMFASDQAHDLALEKNLSKADLAGSGSGRGGTFNLEDVRALVGE